MDMIKIQAVVAGAAAAVMAVITLVTDDDNHSDNHIPREPQVNRDYERELYMNRVLYGGDTHCINQIRMAPNAFLELCKALNASNLLRSTANVSIREQVLVFCHIIGHNVRFRVIGGRFHRSTETVHRYFKIVLQAILKLYKHVMKEPSNSTPPEISNSRRFYPYFKDCIGAIDGTHVRASVPLEIQGRFRGRKDGTTQNVLAAVTFDLRFSYVLAGWEGTCT
ncbi:uncharacterized protein LOC125314797 [Rhodamnia argentea]|uniref:Uncharacterized protein LOC125314797 n=1 Tax=Rhodamnia argentea TaxID=178133 RepID=A0ABM3HBI1_9MYRT|nr:uncharacterized protein LOC125314797 [Rhodamnia argentea]